MSSIKQCTIRFNMDNQNEQKIYEYLIEKSKEKNVSQNHFILRLLEAEMNSISQPFVDADNMVKQIVNGVVAHLSRQVLTSVSAVSDNAISAKNGNDNQLTEDAMDFLSMF